MEQLGVLKNWLKRFCVFQIELEFGSVGLLRRGNESGVPRRKNLSEQKREPTTNSTNIIFFCQRQDLNLGHIGGR